MPTISSLNTIKETLESLAERYPAPNNQKELRDVPRIAFHIGLVKQLVQYENPVIADIGGGIGLFSPGCAALGMTVTLVDDFRDAASQTDSGISALSLHRELGVLVKSADVLAGLSLPRNHFDAITSFDSMEHWHNSPKRLFHGIVDSLRPGGWFILSSGNCVNLRKRITVPLGFGKWSQMSHWYEEAAFRGHVREPDIDDLKYVAKDMGLKDVSFIGRNWLGYHSRPKLRKFMPAIDTILRSCPSLCADIYLVGRKG